jgi:hypothetical protein
MRSRSASYSASRRSTPFHFSLGWSASVEHGLAARLVERRFFHADQALLLLDLVQIHLRHAERIAPRIGGNVRPARPAAVRVEQVLARGEAEHCDRGVCLALVAGGEHDRIVARDRLELGVADRHRVATLHELGNLARREQAHLLRFQKRDDFGVTERRRDLHGKSIIR